MPTLYYPEDFDDWREQARSLLRAERPPDSVEFCDPRSAQQRLFTADDAPLSTSSEQAVRTIQLPRRFLEMARAVGCHRDPHRFNLLYRLAWRMTHGESHVLELATDDDVHRLNRMAQQVHRAAHKTQAFVRFRRVASETEERYIAWHRPEHPILPLVAAFFARRFPVMHWSILTPDESLTWDGQQLQFGPGVPQSAAPRGDDLEELWKTYYASIFNPARIKLKMMRKEMPVRHWETLPETALIPEMLADAPRRVAEMVARGAQAPLSADRFLPEERDLASLAAAAVHCEGCDLHRQATQTVFGRGPATARIMLIGEQPGDQEDRQGEPFVGPAGQILEQALTDAGLSRGEIYLTNAVKHFHWEPSGTRRLHKKPPARAIAACRPWLDAELAVVSPQVLVCLGATAAQALLGRDNRKLQPRGVWFESAACRHTLITWHPAAILRSPDSTDQIERRRELTEHLRVAANCIRGDII